MSVEILNMAEFCSVLTLTTGADGTASLTMGLGDVLVRAWTDGLCAETPVRAEEREVRLNLTETPENMPSGRTVPERKPSGQPGSTSGNRCV